MKVGRNWLDIYDANFEQLVGETLIEIKGSVGDEIMTLCTDSNKTYQIKYYHDCCASCNIEEIHGDLSDLIGSPILLAEEVSSTEPDFELKAQRAKEKAEAEANGYYWGHESETWTFYKLSTIKGSVTIRWYGSSNGYYSERATFERLS